MKGTKMNDFDPDREWTPDEEQYYLENPDEWPDAPEGWTEDEPDPDLDEVQDDDWWHDLDPYGEEDPEWDPPLQDERGLTADGYAMLAKMDHRRDFI